MQRQAGRLFPGQQHGRRVGHDGRVHAQLLQLPQVGCHGLQVLFIQEGVDRHIQPPAQPMGGPNSPFQGGMVEIARKGPQAEALAAHVDGVRAEAKGRLQLLLAARRG